MPMAIDKYPAGTIFSQSFGLAEQTFGGAALNQMTAFDQTYKNGRPRAIPSWHRPGTLAMAATTRTPS